MARRARRPGPVERVVRVVLVTGCMLFGAGLAAVVLTAWLG